MKTQNRHNTTHNHNGHVAVVKTAVTPDAKALLKQIASTLAINDPLTDKQKRSLTPLARYTDAMLLIIANAYDDHGDLIKAEFDSAAVRYAVAFEQKQRPLAAQTKQIADLPRRRSRRSDQSPSPF